MVFSVFSEGLYFGHFLSFYNKQIERLSYKEDGSRLGELRRQLDKLHRPGRIPPSSSPYGAGCQMLRKANGKLRTCVNHRALNTRTVRDQYPLPSIQSILSTPGGSTVFSKINLVTGFHQSRIHDEHIKKTAFNTQFLGVEMGCNALRPLQCTINVAVRRQ